MSQLSSWQLIGVVVAVLLLVLSLWLIISELRYIYAVHRGDDELPPQTLRRKIFPTDSEVAEWSLHGDPVHRRNSEPRVERHSEPPPRAA